MVEHKDALDVVFHALADPTRRAILQRLSAGACSVGELAEPFEISLAATSKHIKVLENAGLLGRAVQGRTHLCSLDVAPMHAGLEWLRHYEQFWNRSLDALEAALRAETASPKRRRKK